MIPDNNYNLIYDTDNQNSFDLILYNDLFLDFDNDGSLSDNGLITDNVNFHYDFSKYSDINSIVNLINYTGRTTSGFTIYDIGLTGVDNGYVRFLTGQTITFDTGSTLFIKPVSGYTDIYPLSFITDGISNTQVLNVEGGFLQGFYKLKDYYYEMIPNRTQYGVTWNFWLNRDSGTTEPNGLKNDNFFYFMGTRAENKYHNIFSGETGYTTSSGVLLSSQTGVTTDVNGIGFFYNNNSLGVKQIINRQDESGNTFTNIFTTATTITPNSNNPWVNITISFTRDEPLEICDDCGCLIPDPILITTYGDCDQDIPSTQTGKLKFFMNARPVMELQIEEPIFSGLTADKDVQQGVPYNISIGGGTQGLYDNVTWNGPDTGDFELFMYNNFGGTFKGNIGIATMYSIPLTIPQIIRNFYAFRDIYKVEETFGGPQVIVNQTLIN